MEYEICTGALSFRPSASLLSISFSINNVGTIGIRSSDPGDWTHFCGDDIDNGYHLQLRFTSY